MPDRELPIGVFDSGVGGLTVLAALRQRLPGEPLLYLGDTARVPYGSRSPETVLRYSERVAGHLLSRGIKALVVACNTATTWALPALQATGARHGVPVIGVIEPGVRRALAATRKGHLAVIGTEGTIAGGRYTSLLRQLDPTVRVEALACPLFVGLAEEGWIGADPVTVMVAERYLAALRGGPDTIILGCTHYPLLAEAIAAVLPGACLVDSARATAEATEELLENAQLLRPGDRPGAMRLLVTDNPERFQRTAGLFLGTPGASGARLDIELVDIDEQDHQRWQRFEAAS